MTDKVQINPMQIPQGKLRLVEKEVGVAVQAWQSALRSGSISAVDLSAFLLAAVNDEPLHKYDGLTPEEILERVEIVQRTDPRKPSEP